jgi:hypothetical protein
VRVIPNPLWHVPVDQTFMGVRNLVFAAAAADVVAASAVTK